MPADLQPAASRAWMSDRPSWCVDRGVTLVAMTTCDLWLALARGDVTPDTKVWREGMPYWDRVARVPEFALALPGSPVWEPVPRSGTRRATRETAAGAVTPETAASERAASETASETAHEAHEAHETAAHEMTAHEMAAHEMAAHEMAAHEAAATEMGYGQIQSEPGPVSDVRPAGSTADERASMDAACELVTPAPVVVEERETERPPARARRRGLPKIDKASALSVAIGATLAVLALTVATTMTAPAPQPAAHHVSAGAPVRGVELPLTPNATAEQRTATEPSAAATTSATATTSAKAPSASNDERARGPRSLDRGQRRARMGTGDRRH